MNSRSVTLRYLQTTKPPQLSCGGYHGCGWVFEQMMKSRHARRSTQIVSSLASAFINPGLIYQKSSLRGINMSDYGSRTSSSNKKSNNEKALKKFPFTKILFHITTSIASRPSSVFSNLKGVFRKGHFSERCAKYQFLAGKCL